ncbi:hypothetical protein RhiirA4_479069 [Rhizophagus irregularis]|uniref:Uncharacterized protein n=1 Tax=Rhizophagus irregularis TaxID=588596 RepID=A0A2I1HFV2_9GLOM|nr:hypothetical protein RhiirA4_479069 [Rhizophagus irregularis]
MDRNLIVAIVRRRPFSTFRTKDTDFISFIHACGVHLSQAFNEIVVRSEKEKLGDIPADFVNNKASHANLLYNRWHPDGLNTSSLKDWYVHKPIKYLKYKQARVASNANDYRFSIPYFVEKHERQLISCGNKLTTVIPVESPIPISPIHTVAPFNPITDMFIPHKYWDIILPDPIYADDGMIGTTKFSILDLRTEDERRKKAQIAKRERLDREQHLEIEAAKQADIVQKKEKAALIGTSWKHVESRSRTMFKYIRLNDMFHAAMTRIREKQLQNLASGGTNHYTKTAREDDPCASPFTSEDTKVLEFQPNKRDVDSNYNLPSHRSLIKQKWLCPDLMTPR